MNEHEKINYVEFPAKDIEKSKAGHLSTTAPNIAPSQMRVLMADFINLTYLLLPRMAVRLSFSIVRNLRRRNLKLKLPGAQS